MAPKVELDKETKKDLEELSKRLKENEKLAEKIMKATAKMEEQKQIYDMLSKMMKTQADMAKNIAQKIR